MPRRSYQLVNPDIEGTFQTVYDAKEPIEAAKSMWKNLTEHVVSHVPNFMFTFREISGGGLHHFEVLENKKDSTFTINELELDVESKLFAEFSKNVDEYTKKRNVGEMKKQTGGRRKRYEDSSSSSSSSSSDIYPTIRRTSPIAMFHYNARVYYTPTYKSTMNPQIVAVQTPVFTPVFRPALNTFVGIWP